MIVGDDGALVEAETFGVIRSSIAKYHADEYHLVRIGPQFSHQDRSQAVGYAERQVGQAFGYLDMLGASFYLLFGWRLHWVRRNHEMCSSLVVNALQAGGLLQGLDPVLTFPADLASIFDVKP